MKEGGKDPRWVGGGNQGKDHPLPSPCPLEFFRGCLKRSPVTFQALGSLPPSCPRGCSLLTRANRRRAPWGDIPGGTGAHHHPAGLLRGCKRYEEEVAGDLTCLLFSEHHCTLPAPHRHHLHHHLHHCAQLLSPQHRHHHQHHPITATCIPVCIPVTSISTSTITPIPPPAPQLTSPHLPLQYLVTTPGTPAGFQQLEKKQLAFYCALGLYLFGAVIFEPE